MCADERMLFPPPDAFQLFGCSGLGETYSWLQGVKILALALTSERRVIFWERLPYFAPVLELLERVPLPARTVASEGDPTAAAASPRLTFKYVKGKTVRWAQIGDKKVRDGLPPSPPLFFLRIWKKERRPVLWRV